MNDLVNDFSGDIPGKCSNFNYSARTAVKMLRAENVITSTMEVIVTTGDCDTVFGDRYFDALEEDYWKTDPTVIKLGSVDLNKPF